MPMYVEEFAISSLLFIDELLVSRNGGVAVYFWIGEFL